MHEACQYHWTFYFGTDQHGLRENRHTKVFVNISEIVRRAAPDLEKPHSMATDILAFCPHAKGWEAMTGGDLGHLQNSSGTLDLHQLSEKINKLPKSLTIETVRDSHETLRTLQEAIYITDIEDDILGGWRRD